MNRLTHKILDGFRVDPIGVEMPGPRLPQRVRKIIEARSFARISGGRFALLVTACAAICVTFAAVTLTHAQSSDTLAWEKAAGGKISFEVSSVKPGVRGTPFGSTVPLDGSDGPSVGGLFRANAPLNAYMNFAFKISDSNQARSIYDKLPAWAKPPHFFEIEGRANGNPTRDQLRLMVQALLADRFKLRVHREMQPRAVYALTLETPDKRGPQLQPHPANKPCMNGGGRPMMIEAPAKGADVPYYCGMVAWRFDGQEHLQIIDMTLSQVANYLASQAVLATGERVPHSGVDETGLAGRFDVNLQFVPEANGAGTSEVPGPRFIQAMEQQLGFRLVDKTAPVKVFVIDNLEQLTLD
ncbi:MAG TPA: TIGR03435 family protein [Candidatus Acidoferrales bacterium]|nr:TIGR03435 family protein [Candidatus Acidoferrales bacterium]